MGADIVNQAMSMGSMIQTAMESLVSPTITAVTTALFTAMFVGKKTEHKGLAGAKTTIFEKEIRTLLDNGRLSYRELNQMKNYLEVAEKADEFHKECGYDKVEPNTQYDIDWFIRFFDAASNVSNEDLQKIWAKLLAGETICKGCFSLRAIETLYNMSSDEARLFSKIADIVIDEQYIFYKMGSVGEEINKKYGFDAPALRLLEEVGVVNALIAEAEDVIEPDECAGFQCGQYLLLVKSESSTALHYKMLLLTKVGEELYLAFHEEKDNYAYLYDLGKTMEKELNVKVGLYRITGYSDADIVQYDETVNLMDE